MLRFGLVLVLAGLLSSVVPAGANAAATPDLAITDAGILDPLVASGARTKVVVPVRNLGRGTSPATTITFFLSTDARFGRDRVLAGAGRVAALRARASRTVTTLVTLPRGLRPDDYRIFACVDQRGAVREASERNNCLRTPEPIRIEPKATPVRVTPQVADGGHPVTQTISAAGGRLYAIGANGAFYMLIVPAGALPYDVRITMKPLAGVAGMPFASGLKAGVQLEPSGLEFAKPATLVISGEGIQPSDQDAVISYRANGTGFHLAPAFPTPPTDAGQGFDPAKTVYVPVLHFSGTGIVPITDQESATQSRRQAAAAGDQLSQEVADRLRNDKDFDDLAERYVDEVLMPEAAAASFSDAMYEAAVRDYIGWERTRQLLGATEESARLRAKLAQLDRLLDAAWKEVVKRAEKRCQQGGFEVIARIIPLERYRQLLGLDDSVNEFSQVVERCWRFELRITSKVKRDVDGGVQGLSGSEHMTWEMQAKVPLRLKGDSSTLETALGTLVGAGPLIYTVREYSGDGQVNFGTLGSGSCTYSFSGQTESSTLAVSDGSIIRRYDGPLEPYFTFEVGQPRELIAQSCSGSGLGGSWSDNEPQWEQHWLSWWRNAHAEWSASGQPGNAEDNGPWTAQLKAARHPVVGTLQFDKSWPDQGASLTETWTLEHKPLPAPR